MQLSGSGKTPQAISLLRGVLVSCPDQPRANYALGMLHHRADRNDRALPHLRRAAASRPGDFDALFNLGLIEHQQGLLSNAQDSIEKSLALDPNSADAHAAHASLLADRGRIDAASAARDRALKLLPENAGLLARRFFRPQRSSFATGRRWTIACQSINTIFPTTTVMPATSKTLADTSGFTATWWTTGSSLHRGRFTGSDTKSW